ncbi:MAG: DUF378 domain-containing protein [Patescibacteria group bacterium]
MKNLSEFERATGIFVLIGAINWGLIGVFGFNLLLVMFNTSPMLERVVEGVIGLSGLFWLYKLLMTKK